MLLRRLLLGSGVLPRPIATTPAPHRRHFRAWLRAARRPSDAVGHANRIRALGRVSAELPVPEQIARPDYYYSGGGAPAAHPHQSQPEIHSADAIRRLRASGQLAAAILHSCGPLCRPGRTTDDIDRHVHAAALAAGAYPSPLRYNGFPKSVCTSVNNVACHGIPDDRPLRAGDVINVDVTVFKDGFHGDCSRMWHVGAADAEAAAAETCAADEAGRHLIRATELCLQAALDVCRAGTPMRAIGCTIDRRARELGVRVVPAFTGHGIGRYFHGAPEVLHYYNADATAVMRPGMVFTVEPVLTLGGNEEVELLEDGWTAWTVDGARTAQMEHTVLIAGESEGCEVLTRWRADEEERE